MYKQQCRTKRVIILTIALIQSTTVGGIYLLVRYTACVNHKIVFFYRAGMLHVLEAILIFSAVVLICTTYH